MHCNAAVYRQLDDFAYRPKLLDMYLCLLRVMAPEHLSDDLLKAAISETVCPLGGSRLRMRQCGGWGLMRGTSSCGRWSGWG